MWALYVRDSSKTLIVTNSGFSTKAKCIMRFYLTYT